MFSSLPVMYPIIHYAEVCPNGNKPPMSLQDPLALGQEFTLQQGEYRIKLIVNFTIIKYPISALLLLECRNEIFLKFIYD